MKVLEYLENYYKMELNDTKGVIEGVRLGIVRWITIDELINGALGRIMGAALFTQSFYEDYEEVTYEAIEDLYKKYKKQIEELKNE
jgi:hypothetical protein